jgi:hypothetical protein
MRFRLVHDPASEVFDKVLLVGRVPFQVLLRESISVVAQVLSTR